MDITIKLVDLKEEEFDFIKAELDEKNIQPDENGVYLISPEQFDDLMDDVEGEE